MTDDETLKHEIVDRMTKEMVGQGRLIEGGWIALQMFALPADAPAIQVQEMRMAFFAGAQHLSASIMSVMEQGDEPTADDLRRMELIQTELDLFAEQLKLRIGRPQGRG